MVDSISSGSSAACCALASVAAWITQRNSPAGKSKSRTSPASSVIAGSLARCGHLVANFTGLRDRTVACAPRPSARLMWQKLSTSQHPKKPVPPVRNRRCPRISGQSSCVCARMRSRSTVDIDAAIYFSGGWFPVFRSVAGNRVQANVRPLSLACLASITDASCACKNSLRGNCIANQVPGLGSVRQKEELIPLLQQR